MLLISSGTHITAGLRHEALFTVWTHLQWGLPGLLVVVTNNANIILITYTLMGN